VDFYKYLTKREGWIYEVWNKKTKSQEKNISKNKYKTSSDSSNRFENASRIWLGQKSEEICL